MTLLIENGADVKAWNHQNRLPLHEASRKGRNEMIELLLKHHSDINAQDDQGFAATSDLQQS